MLKNAQEIVQRNEYSIAAIQDLQFLVKTAPESALKLIDPRAPARLQHLLESAESHIRQQPLTASHYLFLMMVAGSLMRDDHTNVFVNEIKNNKLLYGRFVACYDRGKVRVVHSTDPSIHIGACIARVNGMPVSRYLEEFISWSSPSTENKEVNLRRASAYMCIYNPFGPVNNILLDSGKTVNLKYVQAKRGLFGRQALQTVIFKLIYEKSREQALAASSIEDAGLLYFDLHTFSAQNPDLVGVAQAVSAIKLPWVQWIVLDMRNNFGGSLVVLNQVIRHLYGDKLLAQLQKCTVNRYMANDTFLQQYHDEVILPVISDPDTPAHTKKLYRDVFRLLKAHKSEGEFCDNKAPVRLCQTDLLSRVQRKVAREVLRGAFDKKIVIVTDSHCYSACVWTSKFLSRMPNCVLIGKGVSNTRFSGNAVHFELPSGKGSVALPQVVSQLNNPQMMKAVADEVVPDYALTNDQLKNRKWLIVTLLKNQQLLERCIKEKCMRLVKNKQ